MHGGGGPGLLLRQYLIYGKPWQRALVVAALIAGGVLLLIFGNMLGVLLAAVGVLLAVRLFGPARLRSRRLEAGYEEADDRPGDGEGPTD